MTTTEFIDRLAATPLAERGAVLEALVVAEFRSWLLMEDDDLLPLDESYFGLGLTSLGATEIKQRLEAALGRPFDSATLFNNPTVAHLLRHLRTEVLGDLFGEPPPDEPRSDRQSAEQDLLDDIFDELYRA